MHQYRWMGLEFRFYIPKIFRGHLEISAFQNVNSDPFLIHTIRADKDYYCLAREPDAGHSEKRHRCIRLETGSRKSYSIAEDYSTTGCKGLMR